MLDSCIEVLFFFIHSNLLQDLLQRDLDAPIALLHLLPRALGADARLHQQQDAPELRHGDAIDAIDVHHGQQTVELHVAEAQAAPQGVAPLLRRRLLLLVDVQRFLKRRSKRPPIDLNAQKCIGKEGKFPQKIDQKATSTVGFEKVKRWRMLAP